MQHVSYFFLRLFVELFRFLPFRVLYVLSDALAFVLFRVVGYRKNVVLNGLRRAFPEKTEAEIWQTARLSYQNLADTTLETFKLFTLSLAEIDRRCPCRNPELVNQYLDQGRSIILSGSHFCNWEISGLSIPIGFHGSTVTAYKPLTNKVIDQYLNRNRSRAGMEMVGMDATFSEMRKRREQPTAFILLADQSPSSPKSAHWVEFLGRDSASLPGVDVLARKFNCPVLYFNVQRLRRGYYEVRYEMVWENPAEAGERDITRAYARHLEAIIRAQPENWLWSHKRWKIVRS